MAAQASVLSTPFAGVSPAVARSRAPARASKVVVASRGYPRAAPVSLATARRPQSLSAGIPVVRVRFAARPGAVRASVRVYAEADVYDPAEVSQTPQYRELNRVSVEIQPVPGATFPRGARRGALPGRRKPQIVAFDSRTRGPGDNLANSPTPTLADLTHPLLSKTQSANGKFDAAMKISAKVNIGSQLGGGGSATLERTSFTTGQQVQQTSKARLADGGGGGANGGGIKNGGGGGDGDEGDDDDYFDEGDEEGDGDNFMSTRAPLEERYDRNAINAIMEEWFKTLTTLPAAIRMAIEMGIVSSSQLVRFMSVDIRPSVVRAVSRSTPLPVSRAFIGRLMADPAFLWKLGFEQTVTIAGGLMYEAAHRGDRLKDEWDLAAANIAQLSLVNAMTVWCLTPTRSFGAQHKHAWQRVLDSIPNNAFDKQGPLRQYTMGMRAASVGVKAMELSALGAITGGAFHGLNKALVGLHKKREGDDFEPSVPVPDLKTSVLGMGAFMGLSCNLRYQLIGGADRWMTERLTTLMSAITATGLGRLANNHFGDQTRLFALGLPIHATAIKRTATKATTKKTKKVKKKVKKSKKKKAAAPQEAVMT